jgi:peptidyl-prolyl cis-trans isomerase SurA
VEGIYRMKRFLIGTVLIVFTLNGFCVDVIDQPVARIKLTKTDIIYQSKFMKYVEKYEKQVNKKLTLDEKKQFLDKLVEEKLLIQAAQQAKVVVTQGQIDDKIKQFKQLLELQDHRVYSDDDFKQYIERQSDITWDDFVGTLRDSILQQNYIMQLKDKEIKESAKPPTKEEIEAYYNDNRKNFVAPEMVKFKEILIPTKGKDAGTKKKYLERAKEIYREIQKGASFDNYSEVYVKGSSQIVGTLYIETWQRDDETRKNLYGSSFFTTLFKMEEGTLSDVLESNAGYHIIQILKKYPFALLAIDDKIPPQYTETVREKIKEGLSQKKQIDNFQTAYSEIVADLKKKAEIKIFDDKLTW